MEAGAVSMRHPWLKGAYLELLALLPPFQRPASAPAFLAGSSGRRQGSVRAISGFAPHRSTTARCAFTGVMAFPAATLPGLVADRYDEILLRKFPLHAAQ